MQKIQDKDSEKILIMKMKFLVKVKQVKVGYKLKI